MRLIVLSDTHVPDRARQVPPAILAEWKSGDQFVHAGDFAIGDVLDRLLALAPVHAVHGNVDEGALRQRLPERLTLAFGQHRIGVIHGHTGPGASMTARAAAFDAPVAMVIFGHSHQPVLSRVDDRILFNPGSATDRRSAPRCSYGIVELTEEGALQARHVWL